MNAEWLSITEVVIGTRLREDMGDIAGLAKSIDEFGLLHPIVIDADNNLIAGERRLRAMESLGWKEVEVRRFEEMTPDERRVLELEENLRRKDLTAYERSRNLADMADAAATVDRETGEIRIENIRNPQGGRPSELGSMSRVAERIGVPKPTIQKAREHVTAAERHPILQKPEWKQYQAMEAAELLKSIPDDEQDAVVALVDQPGIPPRDAVEILRNVAQKPSTERRQIVALSTREDDRDRSLALSRAAAFPDQPDGRSVALRSVVREIRKCIKAYPSDPEVEELKSIAERVEAVIRTIDERHKSRVEIAA